MSPNPLSEYTELERSESEEGEGFLPELKSNAAYNKRGWLSIPYDRIWVLLVISNVAWTLLFLALFAVFRRAHPAGTYESGFSTDIAQPEINLEQIRFTGTPQFIKGDDKAYFLPIDEEALWPENKRYFGTPDQEIEDNWEALIGNRYFSISESEAKKAWGEKHREYVDQMVGGYTAGLDLFHTLHCVDMIRRTLYPDFYNVSSPNTRVHAEHCLNVIRQSIQCYGSTTLIPTKYFDGLESNYIDSDQLHTCRSFRTLRNWVNMRQKGGLLYVDRDKSVVDPVIHEKIMELGENHLSAEIFHLIPHT
ncbi:hypothetical protein F5884DRAFT_880843 [Xylogone sp. PMI_703]|nr:hypothetical protein F5884DRAFT_880843 [Xylogone sp. PMI_703]